MVNGAEIECRMQHLHPAIDGVRNRISVPDVVVGVVGGCGLVWWFEFRMAGFVPAILINKIHGLM